MRLAFSTLACPAWTFPQVIAAARAYGYDGIELRLLDGKLVPLDLERTTLIALRTALEEAGLALVAFDTSIRLVSDEPEEAVNDALLRAIACAEALQAPVIRVFGGPIPAGVSWDDACDRAARLLRDSAPRAEACGVTIALETHDSFASARRVAAVLERVPSRAVGALWDTLHPARMGESVEEVWEALGDRVVLVHVKDGRRRGETWELCLLEEGDVPVRAALELLHRQGYRGWLSVEWEKHWHPELAEPEVALPHHANTLRAWLTELAPATSEISKGGA